MEDQSADPASSTSFVPVRRRNFATRNRRILGAPLLHPLKSEPPSPSFQKNQERDSEEVCNTNSESVQESKSESILDGRGDMHRSPFVTSGKDIGNASTSDPSAESSSGQQEEQQQQQQRQQQQQQQNSQGQLDSITLGQLRNLVNNHKPKARQYSYPTHADSDTLPQEIDEFYSYVEAPQVVENRAAWEEWCALAAKGEAIPLTAKEEKSKSENGPAFGGGALGLGLEDFSNIGEDRKEGEKDLAEWTNLPTSARRKRIQALLTLLEVKDPTARQRASRALLYLLQGSFTDTKGTEHQLSWIMENARMVRAAGGLGEIYSAFKIASWKHDWLR